VRFTRFIHELVIEALSAVEVAVVVRGLRALVKLNELSL
jgi:hypothetical protein